MTSSLLLLALCAVTSLASARITSRGQTTAASVRAPLLDSAFAVRPRGAPNTVAPDRRYYVWSTSPKRNPALAATDTQVQINTVRVQAGKRFFKHYHPRGVETITVNHGRIHSQLFFEGTDPRVVEVYLGQQESTVYPQGLVHLATCVSKTDCVFTAVFNTADAGTVPVA